MRVAVLSDIHANLDALKAALGLVERHRADSLICLGDVVGYGPDPEECLELVRSTFDVCLLGNHDEAVAFNRGLGVLPKDAQTMIRRHQKALSDADLAWLRELPLRYDSADFTAVHASPESPEKWFRLSTYQSVQTQFEFFEGAICFVGHSHKPAVVSDSVGVLRVRPGHRFLVDVGSVGQPRDGDPRLSFALFNTEDFSCEFVRGHYDLERTITRMKAKGLPSKLGNRLRSGT